MRSDEDRVPPYSQEIDTRIPTAPPEMLFANRPSTPPPSYQEACRTDSIDGVYLFEEKAGSSNNELSRRLSCNREFDNNQPIPERAREKRSPNSRHRNYSRENTSERQNRNCTHERAPNRHLEERIIATQISVCESNESYFETLDKVEASFICGFKHIDIHTAIQMHYLQKRKLFNDRPIFRYTITKVRGFCIWNYELTTITESRMLSRKQRPYPGTLDPRRYIDSSPPLSAWDYDVSKPALCSSRKIDLPDSVSIATCDSCHGDGALRCSRCEGEGKHTCERCSGTGHIQAPDSGRRYNHLHPSYKEDWVQPRLETCHDCHGTSVSRCCMCHGSAVQTCKCCRGYGKVEKYSQLFIQWNCAKSNFSSEKIPIPSHLTKESKSMKVYENSSKAGSVRPITASDCIHKGVIRASKRFTKDHQPTDDSQVTRKQKHAVTITPVYEVTCHKKSKQKVFILAGTNMVVYKPWLSSCNVS